MMGGGAISLLSLAQFPKRIGAQCNREAGGSAGKKRITRH